MSPNGDVMMSCVKPLLTTSWLSNKYVSAKHSKLMGLLKGKLMSLAMRVSHCPIVSCYISYLFRKLKKYKALVPSLNRFQTNNIKYAIHNLKNVDFTISPEIDMVTRKQYARNYLVPVDLQLDVELNINLSGDELTFTSLSSLFPRDCQIMASFYVVVSNIKDAMAGNFSINDKNENKEKSRKTVKSGAKCCVPPGCKRQYREICAQAGLDLQSGAGPRSGNDDR
jgi:hypothetical protein